MLSDMILVQHARIIEPPLHSLGFRLAGLAIDLDVGLPVDHRRGQNGKMAICIHDDAEMLIAELVIGVATVTDEGRHGRLHRRGNEVPDLQG
jgi:hypothetical protein